MLSLDEEYEARGVIYSEQTLRSLFVFFFLPHSELLQRASTHFRLCVFQALYLLRKCSELC